MTSGSRGFPDRPVAADDDFEERTNPRVDLAATRTVPLDPGLSMHAREFWMIWERALAAQGVAFDRGQPSRVLHGVAAQQEGELGGRVEGPSWVADRQVRLKPFSTLRANGSSLRRHKQETKICGGQCAH